MFSSVLSFGIHGIESFCVRVEADISDGMPVFELVGYLSSEVKEARERVRTALRNAGYSFPVKRVTLNLSPGNIKKRGTGYDLPMAIAILAAMEQISSEELKDTLVIGELMLNGEVSGINGVLPMVLKARENGLKRCIVPKANAMEAALVDDITIIGVGTINEAVMYLRNEMDISPYTHAESDASDLSEDDRLDLKYVRGQLYARRGAEIAAAGMHNLLMIGAPGAGKSMLAKCIPTILPPLTKDEALEVSAIYSVSGMLNDAGGLIGRRPFISPHHTVTDIAMTGGGTYPKPGNISLAHRGVLFLDEMAEFSRYTLEVLRQPLEDRKITITRNYGSFTYPADFMMVGAMNPCPCGAYPDLTKCSCTQASRKKYLNKLSKPLIDRMDICVDVEKLDFNSMFTDEVAESSEEVRRRVVAAHDRQAKRFINRKISFNSQMSVNDINEFCRLDRECETWLAGALASMDVSARSYHKIIRVARTIADLAEDDYINRLHLSEAIMLNNSYVYEGGA